MNRIARAVILSAAALATVATTIEFASAGEVHWRKHHARSWKKKVVVTGVVAGTVVSARPRVIHRERPLLVQEESPFYDDETVYDDGTAYSEPALPRRAYRDDMPEDDEYAQPYEDDDMQGYDDRRAARSQDDDYFPERPAANHKRKPSEAVTRTETQRRPVKRKSTQQADARALRPWSREWKEWCAGRFPSFNPQNGTYLGYDRKRHFCKAG